MAEAHSKTTWKQYGRKLLDNAEPHKWISIRVRSQEITFPVYTIDQTKEVKKFNITEPIAHPLTKENVLAATFAVNRSAKRYRDASQSCYRSSAHGLAQHNKQQKEMLYNLKDRGIVFAYRIGELLAVKTSGSFTVYRGQGYCFHSLLRPESVQLDNTEENVFVESKPRGSSEMKLKDAIATLEQIKDDTNGFIKNKLDLCSFTSKSFNRCYTYGSIDDDDDDDYDDDFLCY